MKLLHVISSVNPKGGGPIEGIRQLHLPMRDLGISVDVACCDVPGSPWLENTGLTTIYALGPAKLGYAYAPKLFPWLKENAPRYDAVIVNGLWQYTGLAVWRALSGTQTPYFVFTHGMLDPWFKYTYPLKHLKKWLYWPWAEYRVLRDARAVIFTCEEERLLARDSFWLYKVNEVVTSYGTTTPPQDSDALVLPFLDMFPECCGKRLVLFLSRIHEKKGCDLLIEAFARIAKRDHNLHLVVAGPDQTGWADTLKALAAGFGLDNRITWTGMLQGDIKWGAFHACEVFCLPSHQENFGIVVAEALACGKPVLISNKVNIWREIYADQAGFVSDDTYDGTVQLLVSWLQLDDVGYTAMSDRARVCFQQRFHIQRAAERLIEIVKLELE